MNPRITLLLAASLPFGAAMAQPTLTEANNVPAAGDIYSISASDADSIGSATGANVTFGSWMLEEQSNRNKFFLAPSVSSTSAAIPAAELLSTDGGSDTLFWSSDANGLYLEGERTAATFAYSDKVKEMTYPCTYGTTWNDNGSATYAIGAFNVVRSVVLTGIADGHGTLQLPFGSIDNVLRVKTRKATTDQSFTTLERITNTISFYVDTVPFPVLRLVSDSLRVGGGAWGVTYTNEWMYGPGIVGLNTLDATEVTFTCYPNPATDLVNLSVDLDGPAICEVVDAGGRIVLSRTLAAQGLATVPVATLPAGLYTARITDANGPRTARFQVVR
ncbi:MAG: T9SS type A sorting domain-containing protein [Flavobacteriales bacterium]|nr:T9SS type A sorting domain-containing protein [Flavobacteriales bacterium]